MASFEDLFNAALNMGNAVVTSPLAGVLGVKSPTAQAGEESKVQAAVGINPDMPGAWSGISPLMVGGAVVVLVLVVVLIRGRR